MAALQPLPSDREPIATASGKASPRWRAWLQRLDDYTRGLFGGQVPFPATQNASTDPNTLDDYEEGRTTPTVTASTGTFTTVSATVDYTKVGRLVVCVASIVMTTAGTAADALLLPLPFTGRTGSIGSGAGREVASTGFAVTVTIPSAGTQATIYKYDNTTIIGSGRTVYVTFSYFTV